MPKSPNDTWYFPLQTARPGDYFLACLIVFGENRLIAGSLIRGYANQLAPRYPWIDDTYQISYFDFQGVSKRVIVPLRRIDHAMNEDVTGAVEIVAFNEGMSSDAWYELKSRAVDDERQLMRLIGSLFEPTDPLAVMNKVFVAKLDNGTAFMFRARGLMAKGKEVWIMNDGYVEDECVYAVIVRPLESLERMRLLMKNRPSVWNQVTGSISLL